MDSQTERTIIRLIESNKRYEENNNMLRERLSKDNQDIDAIIDFCKEIKKKNSLALAADSGTDDADL